MTTTREFREEALKLAFDSSAAAALYHQRILTLASS